MIDPSQLVLPDVTGAVMLRLRADPRLVSPPINCHPSPRVWTIAPQISPDWDMNKAWAIIVNEAGGPMLDSWEGVPVHAQRFDLWCYGPGDNLAARKMNANLLWRTMHPILCPPRNSAQYFWQQTSRAFVIGHCRVMDVQQESEPRPGPEPETGWGRWDCSYIVLYNELPA